MALWVLIALIYLLCGQLYSVAYLLNYPEDRPVTLGLMGMFWPILIVIEFVLILSKGFGQISRKLANKVK